MVDTILFQFDLIRFRKDFSVCIIHLYVHENVNNFLIKCFQTSAQQIACERCKQTHTNFIWVYVHPAYIRHVQLCMFYACRFRQNYNNSIYIINGYDTFLWCIFAQHACAYPWYALQRNLLSYAWHMPTG